MQVDFFLSLTCKRDINPFTIIMKTDIVGFIFNISYTFIYPNIFSSEFPNLLDLIEVSYHKPRKLNQENTVFM